MHLYLPLWDTATHRAILPVPCTTMTSQRDGLPTDRTALRQVHCSFLSRCTAEGLTLAVICPVTESHPLLEYELLA